MREPDDTFTGTVSYGGDHRPKQFLPVPSCILYSGDHLIYESFYYISQTPILDMSPDSFLTVATNMDAFQHI